MALLDLFQPILDRLWDKLKAALGPFGKLFDLVGQLFHGVTNSFTTGKAIANTIVNEIHEWRNFREAIPVRTGVISLPSAIDKTQQLLDQLRAAWDAIVDLVKETRDLLARAGEAPPEEEAAQALEDIESSGVKGILEKFPKLAKGLEKLLGWLAILISVFDNVSRAMNDLKAIVDAIAAIREEIETGSTVFLSHKNPRKLVHLDDGTVMKIRVGSLHPSA